MENQDDSANRDSAAFQERGQRIGDSACDPSRDRSRLANWRYKTGYRAGRLKLPSGVLFADHRRWQLKPMQRNGPY